MPKEQYALCKQKIPINKEKQILKIAKTIIALLDLLKDNIELILLATRHDLKISILKTYKEAINNLNYNQ